MIDWSEVKEGDRLYLTVPVTVKVVGFHDRHAWVRLDGWARHEFAVPSDLEGSSVIFIDEDEVEDE